MSAPAAVPPGTTPALRPVSIPVLSVPSVVVPLGPSAAAETALAPAADVARRFGASIDLLGVAVEQAEAEVMAKRLEILAEPLGAAAHTRVAPDVAAAILRFAADGGHALVCMASHGRGRLQELVLGSFTAGLLGAADRPVLLAGPDLDPARRLGHGPVLACVDGSEASRRGVPVAAAWAAALGVALEIVTVAADPSPGAPLEALAATWRGADLEVTGRVLAGDGPADGLARHLAVAPASLLVVTTSARTGLRRMAVGSETAAIVRTSPLPVLVVPPHDPA